MFYNVLRKIDGKKRSPDECLAISNSKKGKPLTEKQVIAQNNYHKRNFANLFQKHLDNFIKDPTAEKQWRFDMTRKKKDGRLDQEYIDILNNTPTFTWSS
jgi:hypothetical protein